MKNYHCRSACPSSLYCPLRGSRTLLNGLGGPERDTQDPLHAQEERLQLIITVCGPDSVLPDVLAMHTIEMIPKSMILNNMAMNFRYKHVFLDNIAVDKCSQNFHTQKEPSQPWYTGIFISTSIYVMQCVFCVSAIYYRYYFILTTKLHA